MFHKQKNTIKNIVFGLEKQGVKYFKTSQNVASKSIKYLGEGGYVQKYKVPYMARGTKQLFTESKQAIKKSVQQMGGKELRSLVNLAYKSKPYLPFLFVTGGFVRMTEFNLMPQIELSKLKNPKKNFLSQKTKKNEEREVQKLNPTKEYRERTEDLETQPKESEKLEKGYVPDKHVVHDLQPEKGGYEINQEEFNKMRAERDVIVLDTRSVGNYTKGHIPNVLFIPFERQVKGQIENKKNLDSYIQYMENIVQDPYESRHKFSEQDLRTIDGAVKKTQTWVDNKENSASFRTRLFNFIKNPCKSNQVGTAEEYSEQKKKLESICNPIINTYEGPAITDHLSNFQQWCKMFLPANKRILLVTNVEENNEVDIIMQLKMIGIFKNVIGYLEKGQQNWNESGFEVEIDRLYTPADLNENILNNRADEINRVQDVRNREEWESDGVFNNASLQELDKIKTAVSKNEGQTQNLTGFRKDAPIYFFSNSGQRSAIAMSWFKMHGFTNCRNIYGGRKKALEQNIKLHKAEAFRQMLMSRY